MKCPFCGGTGTRQLNLTLGYSNMQANRQAAHLMRGGHPVVALAVMGLKVFANVLTKKYRCQACGRAF